MPGKDNKKYSEASLREVGKEGRWRRKERKAHWGYEKKSESVRRPIKGNLLWGRLFRPRMRGD